MGSESDDASERRNKEIFDHFGVTPEAISAAMKRGDPSASPEAEMWARAWGGTDRDWVADQRRMRRAERRLLRVQTELLQWEAADSDATIGLREAAEIIRAAIAGRKPHL